MAMKNTIINLYPFNHINQIKIDFDGKSGKEVEKARLASFERSSVVSKALKIS